MYSKCILFKINHYTFDIQTLYISYGVKKRGRLPQPITIKIESK